MRKNFIELVGKIKVLDILDGTRELAQVYIEHDIVPEEYFDDALHIALASLHQVDCIVSWNFKHMVNPVTRRQIKGINLLKGYKEIDIVTPEELGGEKYE